MAGVTDQVDSKKKDVKTNEMTEDWDPVKVSKVIYNAHGYDSLHGWSTMATHLDVHLGEDKLDLDVIGQSILLNKKTNLKALADVLDVWKKRKGKDATIYALVNELRALNWVDQAEKVEAAAGITSNR